MMKKAIENLLKEIEVEAAYTESYTGRKKFSDQVMKAMGEVPREEFIPGDLQHMAYANHPLSIGFGQTISQPYIVALMTDFLDLTPESVVLEIGTGSGYQAAILSRLAKQVFTVEKIRELYESATQRLKRLGYDNVETRCSNGFRGWEEEAPFDGIIVTAAASHIPPMLVDQLKPGGKLVIPIGLPHMHQELLLVEKAEDGTTQTRVLLGVAFVPLVDEDPED